MLPRSVELLFFFCSVLEPLNGPAAAAENPLGQPSSKMITVFESGKVKASERRRLAPSFKCCAQDTGAGRETGCLNPPPLQTQVYEIAKL